MEKTGCKIICGAPTTLAVNELMMMMKMMMMMMMDNSDPGKATAVARAGSPIRPCWHSIFTCPNNGMAASSGDLHRAHTDVNACVWAGGLQAANTEADWEYRQL